VSANAHDATIYRPRFIDVPPVAFDPAAAVPAPGTSAVQAAAAMPVTKPVNPMAGQGIHNSGPPFPMAHPPAPPSTSAKAAPTATAAMAADNIDGSTDWFKKGLGDGCPSVAPPSTPILSNTTNGIVEASWLNVGTDVWYFAWICDATVHVCPTPSTSVPWLAAWGGLWSTEPHGFLDPIDLTTSTEVPTNGHQFAVYIQSSGAGSGYGGNSAPSLITVSK
jgi:hypothetical protein